jgi:hypothetical protein
MDLQVQFSSAADNFAHRLGMAEPLAIGALKEEIANLFENDKEALMLADQEYTRLDDRYNQTSVFNNVTGTKASPWLSISSRIIVIGAVIQLCRKASVALSERGNPSRGDYLKLVRNRVNDQRRQKGQQLLF